MFKLKKRHFFIFSPFYYVLSLALPFLLFFIQAMALDSVNE